MASGLNDLHNGTCLRLVTCALLCFTPGTN